MRKSEMTEQQLQERTTTIQLLSRAKWSDLSTGNWFERNMDFEPEASMEYHGKFLGLQVDYVAKNHSLIFSLQNRDGSSIEFDLYFENALKKILESIISFQDEISLRNYKDYLRKLLKVCPKIYTATGEERDTLVLLADEENL